LAGLSFRWISERLSITYASRESVRLWRDKFSKLYNPVKRIMRREVVQKAKGEDEKILQQHNHPKKEGA